MTGNLPTNSGMRPYWTRSVCSTSFSKCDIADAFHESWSLALQTELSSVKAVPKNHQACIGVVATPIKTIYYPIPRKVPFALQVLDNAMHDSVILIVCYHIEITALAPFLVLEAERLT